MRAFESGVLDDIETITNGPQPSLVGMFIHAVEGFAIIFDNASMFASTFIENFASVPVSRYPKHPRRGDRALRHFVISRCEPDQICVAVPATV